MMANSKRYGTKIQTYTLKNGDITSTVENVIFEEIKESENFENAQKFADIIADIIEHEIPKNEKEYLIINGCLLMEG